MISKEINDDRSNISMATAELHDLTKFWDGLSFSERDQSIVTVTDLLRKSSVCSSDVSPPTIGKMYEQIKFLTSSNHIEKQSSSRDSIIRPLAGMPNGTEKPNFNRCMEIIHSLSPKELLTLGEYMGLSASKLSLIKPAKLYGMYEDVLTTGSTAIFFATRNYLEKM